MEGENRLKHLLHRFNNGTATTDELTVLEGLLADPEASQLLQELWEKTPAEACFFEDGKSETMLGLILQRNRNKTVVQTVPKQRRSTWPLLVAAVFILLVVGASLFVPEDKAKNTTGSVATGSSPNRIVPGGDKALLVLNDGSTVTLDSSSNGTISIQGAAQVSKASGRLIYAANTIPAEKATGVFYNTLHTRRGGQYQLVLADSTRVWMNASSSLRFPTAFPGKERVVELTGEAYFEVAKDARRTFNVKVNGMVINVLGTHFNVMAYENEAATAVTLLEGAVKVSGEKDNVRLLPGQQALLEPGTALRVINDVNLEKTIAWKNGYFQLDRTDLAVLMRQIERWYDVDVVYEGKIPNRQFGGKISRSSNIKEIMQVLEVSKVHSRIEGNKIVILDK